MAITCGLVWDTYPLPAAGGRLQRIPYAATGLVGQDVPLTAREKLALGRVQLIHRRYHFDGHDFYLTVIDGTRDRHAVHDPRYCFEGAGWRLTAERPLPLPAGAATWLRMAQGDRQAESVFWFSDGAARYASVPRYWWQTTLRRLTLGHSGPEPVMVVLQSYDDDPPDWPKLADRLIAAFGL